LNRARVFVVDSIEILTYTVGEAGVVRLETASDVVPAIVDKFDAVVL
jgi:hypothetical protein